MHFIITVDGNSIEKLHIVFSVKNWKNLYKTYQFMLQYQYKDGENPYNPLTNYGDRLGTRGDNSQEKGSEDFIFLVSQSKCNL